MPDAIECSPELGVHGDRWLGGERSTTDNQISLINVHVIDSLAKRDPARAALAGDNLHVDLDLSEENLPVGARLHVGTAVLEVTALPHRPCRHFVAHFGLNAAKKIARANRLGLRGRGVLCRIVQTGRIESGDSIHVQRP